MNYEINFLILQSQTEKIAKIRSKVKELIKKNEGTITDELNYQKRKLAYKIKHEQYGFYTVYRFDLENGENLKKLTKDLNLEKAVARYIIVKSNEIPALQKEIGKAPKTEEERKAEALKKSPKKKDGKKILDELTKETSEQLQSKTSSKKSEKSTAKKIVDKIVKKVQKKEDTQETKMDEQTKSKKVEEVKDIKKKENPPKTDQQVKKKEKEEISIDDLDKKLDEILDI